jgi:hypothetical protein
MRNDVLGDMKWSSKLFLNDIWPMLNHVVGGGQLMQMEGRPDQQLAKELDMRSGIDAWQLMPCGQMRGIAARVQQSNKNWATFTVRLSRDSGAKTEFAKRYEAINDGRGLIYPHLTIQGYAETKVGPVISVGVCRTVDVIEFVSKGLCDVNRTTNASFAVCPWEKMKEVGYKVEVIEPKVLVK